MSQIQKHLVGLAQTASKKPVESGERLAASLVSQFKMKNGTEVALRPIRPDVNRISVESVGIRHFGRRRAIDS